MTTLYILFFEVTSDLMPKYMLRLDAEVHDKLKTEFSDLQYLILHFSSYSDKKCR